MPRRGGGRAGVAPASFDWCRRLGSTVLAGIGVVGSGCGSCGGGDEAIERTQHVLNRTGTSRRDAILSLGLLGGGGGGSGSILTKMTRLVCEAIGIAIGAGYGHGPLPIPRILALALSLFLPLIEGCKQLVHFRVTGALHVLLVILTTLVLEALADPRKQAGQRIGASGACPCSAACFVLGCGLAAGAVFEFGQQPLDVLFGPQGQESRVDGRGDGVEAVGTGLHLLAGLIAIARVLVRYEHCVAWIFDLRRPVASEPRRFFAHLSSILSKGVSLSHTRSMAQKRERREK